MKIALAFPGCHRRGGVERVMLECALFLASRGHDVEVFANEWDASALAAVRCHFVPMLRRPAFLRGPSFFRRCTKELSRSRFDLLNSHGCICPAGGVQWVHSVHRVWLERSRLTRSPMSLSRWKQRLNPVHPILLKMERQHFRQGNYLKLIVTTPQVKADLQRLYNVPADDIVIVPNGFSPTEFTPVRRMEMRSAMRQKLGLKPEHIALLFVANELERKGYATILAAMALLRRPELRLFVVGKTSERYVRSAADHAGLGQQVLWCGPTLDVASFHAAADLFVLPTQYEAFCLAILEALGSGLPVVTTTVPGAADAIRPGENGCLINDPGSGEELAEALRPLFDPELRNKLSVAAPETVRSYQWPVVLERYEQVLLDARP